MEVGARVSYSADDYGKELLEGTFNRLKLAEIDNVSYMTDHGNLSLNFSSTKIRGSIENIKKDEGSEIIINIVEKSTSNNIEELINKISRRLNTFDKRIQYTQYIKAKVNTCDTAGVNEEILSYLRSIGTSDLESIDISNGYSTVGYTSRFEPINYGYKLIDFNYAVVTYSSGTYIIIGTPIIMTPY